MTALTPYPTTSRRNNPGRKNLVQTPRIETKAPTREHEGVTVHPLAVTPYHQPRHDSQPSENRPS